MSTFDSPHWDWEIGVCRKHMLPAVPCPACMAEPKDKDVEETLTDMDVWFGEPGSDMWGNVPEKVPDG